MSLRVGTVVVLLPRGGPHLEVGMDGKSILEKLRELGLDLPDEFACFLVVLADEAAMIWTVEGTLCVGPS